MESRVFIKAATALRADIKEFAAAYLTDEEATVQGDAIQKRINATFTGLQNPTLPSAFNLYKEATDAGFQVDPRVVHKIHQHEGCWQ